MKITNVSTNAVRIQIDNQNAWVGPLSEVQVTGLEVSVGGTNYSRDIIITESGIRQQNYQYKQAFILGFQVVAICMIMTWAITIFKRGFVLRNIE
jgi:hypothetical protein